MSWKRDLLASLVAVFVGILGLAFGGQIYYPALLEGGTRTAEVVLVPKGAILILSGGFWALGFMLASVPFLLRIEKVRAWSRLNYGAKGGDRA